MTRALAPVTPHRLIVALTLVLAAMLAAAAPVHAGTRYLELSNNGLEDLGDWWVYEGWLIVDGAPVSTGTFSISNGMPYPSRFAVEIDASASISAFVLTIEPVPDADPAPSAVHVLAGDLVNGMAQLTAGHAAALGDDLSSAAGSYILNAPSGGDMAMYFNGIWWLDPEGGFSATLSLPMLPEGWRYEGWVVGPDGPISTGRFSDPTLVDSDGPGITGGPYAAPPFPGQDLVVPPLDLTSGYAAVLSIEPEPDNSPAPFAFKPLVDSNIDDVGAGVLQDMMNNAASFASATVTLSEADAMEIAHLFLSFNALESLGPDYAYEGWLVVDGAPVSTGVFTVEGGVPSARYFPTPVSDLDAISAFVLTIEPMPDDNPAPSHLHLIAGDVIDGRAALSVDHPAAFGTDFSDASGSYILNAPTGGGSADYRNGIWWLDPEGEFSATLMLPTLPQGWVYEGWVAGSEGPVSTGRFSMASGVDDDGAGPQSGESEFPPFPGQDFINPVMDLTAGYAAVISVEPEPDNSAGPFAIKPLLDPVIDDVGAGVLQPMHRNTAALPSGSVVLARAETIPAAASTAGVGGSMWRTDLSVSNDGMQSALILLQLLVSNQANSEPETVMLDLAAGASMRYTDVLDDLFDTTGTAALRVLSSSDDVVLTSRTYADTAQGTFGQGIPAYGMMSAIGYGEVGRLVGLSEGDSYRTNIGLVNAGSESCVVMIELLANDGSLVRTRTVTLAAGEHRQINGAFDETVEVGWARVSTATPGGRFFAYASVLDNSTDDPSFISVR